jgi:hypothetical protein
MKKAQIGALPRGERPGRASPSREEAFFVKLFLDKRDKGGYAPRFSSERPAPRG